MTTKTCGDCYEEHGDGRALTLPEVVLCPLHATTEDMREALEAAVKHLSHEQCRHEKRSHGNLERLDADNSLARVARAALAKEKRAKA